MEQLPKRSRDRQGCSRLAAINVVRPTVQDLLHLSLLESEERWALPIPLGKPIAQSGADSCPISFGEVLGAKRHNVQAQRTAKPSAAAKG